MRDRADTPRLRRLIGALPAPPAAARPIGIIEVELSEPLPTIRPEGCAAAQVLVLLHGQPLGMLKVSLEQGPVVGRALRAAVERELHDALHDHLKRDGLDQPAAVSGNGHQPLCLRDLEPPDPPPRVTVVIATCDRARQLASCLDSLTRLAYPAFDVVVVDNAPSDESTRDLVEGRFGEHSNIRYVREPRAGVSNARNVGARMGRGDIVAFTDDDVVVHRLWLKALVRGFADPRVTCVTGLTLPGRLETAAEQAFEEYGSMSLGFERCVYDRDRHRGRTRLYPYSAGIFGASNNAAFRRADFLRRGGFDLTLGPGTPAGGAEDLDAFLAVILAGERIVYDPRAMVRHEHRSDFRQLYWQVFMYSAGFTAFLTKWALTDRSVGRDLLRRVPPQLPAALFHRQRSDFEDHGEYLRQLRWLERAGYLYGPVAYARSRLAAARATGDRARPRPTAQERA